MADEKEFFSGGKEIFRNSKMAKTICIKALAYHSS
ncbi:hypothetical protein BB14905_13430 [Bacillus sp. B14905]|nr:hypothetical protein BB14905_13430 [Bacillus sp. B14905]